MSTTADPRCPVSEAMRLIENFARPLGPEYSRSDPRFLWTTYRPVVQPTNPLAAFALVADFTKRDSGKESVHSAVIAITRNPVDNAPSVGFWCGDTCLEGKHKKGAKEYSRSVTEVLQEIQIHKKGDEFRRYYGFGAEMMEAWGSSPVNTGCGFWSARNSGKTGCKHVYALFEGMKNGELVGKEHRGTLAAMVHEWASYEWRRPEPVCDYLMSELRRTPPIPVI